MQQPDTARAGLFMCTGRGAPDVKSPQLTMQAASPACWHLLQQPLTSDHPAWLPWLQPALLGMTAPQLDVQLAIPDPAATDIFLELYILLQDLLRFFNHPAG